MFLSNCYPLMSSVLISESRARMRKHRRETMRQRLSPDQFIEWEKEQTIERRHQEIVDAIRATKPDAVPQDDGIGMTGIIFAACIAGSIANN